MAELNRVDGIHVPWSGFRVATCKEVMCGAYTYGWETYLLLGRGDLNSEKSFYDIMQMGLRFRNEGVVEDVTSSRNGFTRLVFEPGQACFNSRIEPHKKKKENALELYYTKDLINGTIRKFNRPGDWVESSAEHFDNLNELVKRG
jgi:hypothetical protein